MVLSLPESDPIRSNDDNDLFEFLTPTTMCAAADVISDGKLLPFWAPPPPKPKKPQAHVTNLPEPDHRRSNSLGKPPCGCWGGKVSDEYRRLKRVPDPDHEKAAPDLRRSRPRWYVLAFGSVRVPKARELKEIRNRQRRRSAPPVGHQDSGKWGPWNLLRSLSCKGTETVIAT